MTQCSYEKVRRKREKIVNWMLITFLHPYMTLKVYWMILNVNVDDYIHVSCTMIFFIFSYYFRYSKL